jgi:hypothetical protein
MRFGFSRENVVIVVASVFAVAGVLPTVLSSGMSAPGNKPARSGLFAGRPCFENLSGTFAVGNKLEVALSCRSARLEYGELLRGIKVSASRYLVIEEPSIEYVQEGQTVFSAKAHYGRFSLNKRAASFRTNVALSCKDILSASAEGMIWDMGKKQLVLQSPYELSYRGESEKRETGRRVINLNEIVEEKP